VDRFVQRLGLQYQPLGRLEPGRHLVGCAISGNDMSGVKVNCKGRSC
jgi:hypothetical protein